MKGSFLWLHPDTVFSFRDWLSGVPGAQQLQTQPANAPPLLDLAAGLGLQGTWRNASPATTAAG